MKRRNRLDGWFMQRGYAHIDRPLSFKAASELVKSSKRIASLSFFPLLGYADKKRKFRTDNSIKSIPNRLRPRTVGTKVRDLKYASHRDSYIYSYYAKILGEHYESFLASNGLSECVVGYRKGMGSNVDIAARAFGEIAIRPQSSVFCYDIKNFFPSIPHQALKMAMSHVLGVKLLSEDWYNLFWSLTRYNWIDIDQLYLWCLINPKVIVPNPICTDPVELLADLRANGMIRRNSEPHGIPQGTPISAVLANVAMVEFDRAAAAWARANNSIYMRYSDDIIFITPGTSQIVMDANIDHFISRVGPSLKIGHDKTEVSNFFPVNGAISCDKPISYLGFTFDGERVLLRSSTLSRYYRRMTYSTRRTGTAARKAFKQGGSASPYRRALFRDFTHLAKANFYTYAMRSQGKFGGDAIRKQMRKHFSILLRKLKSRGK